VASVFEFPLLVWWKRILITSVGLLDPEFSFGLSLCSCVTIFSGDRGTTWNHWGVFTMIRPTPQVAFLGVFMEDATPTIQYVHDLREIFGKSTLTYFWGINKGIFHNCHSWQCFCPSQSWFKLLSSPCDIYCQIKNGRKVRHCFLLRATDYDVDDVMAWHLCQAFTSKTGANRIRWDVERFQEDLSKDSWRLGKRWLPVTIFLSQLVIIILYSFIRFYSNSRLEISDPR